MLSRMNKTKLEIIFKIMIFSMFSPYLSLRIFEIFYSSFLFTPKSKHDLHTERRLQGNNRIRLSFSKQITHSNDLTDSA